MPPKNAKSTLSKSKIIVEEPTIKQINDKKIESFHYEFGGPIGAVGVIFGLPIVIYALFFLCNDKICMKHPLTFDWNNFIVLMPKSIDEIYSHEALLMYIGWMSLNLFLERFLPGESVEGALLENGKTLKYTISGHLQFWICIVSTMFAYPILREYSPGSKVYSVVGFSTLPLNLIYNNYVQLITVSLVGSFILSVYL
jgi:hypothetical protein